MNRGDRCTRIGRGATGDDRHGDVLGLHPRDEIANIHRDFDHQQIGAAAGA